MGGAGMAAQNKAAYQTLLKQTMDARKITSADLVATHREIPRL